MADLFSGLGGLMKGLSNFMPQDDPNTKLLKLQGEVADLKKQETNLYTEIGKKAGAEMIFREWEEYINEICDK